MKNLLSDRPLYLRVRNWFRHSPHRLLWYVREKEGQLLGQMISQYQAPIHHVESEKYGHTWIPWANSGFQCFRQQLQMAIEQCHV